MGSKHDIAEALLNRLRNLARDVSLAIAKKDVDVAKALSAQMQFLAELLSLSWPVSGVPSPLNDLLRHVYFVNYYVIRTGWESAEGNANDFPKDLDTLVAKLSALQSTTRPDLWTKVDSMPDGFSKALSRESVAALEAGAFRVAIVAAGASLEKYARTTYETATGKSSGGVDFVEVIKSLEGLPKGALPKEQLAVVDMLRLYRNLTAHRSEFQGAENYAPPRGACLRHSPSKALCLKHRLH